MCSNQGGGCALHGFQEPVTDVTSLKLIESRLEAMIANKSLMRSINPQAFDSRI
jgi:hypothetical protein